MILKRLWNCLLVRCYWWPWKHLHSWQRRWRWTFPQSVFIDLAAADGPRWQKKRSIWVCDGFGDDKEINRIPTPDGVIRLGTGTYYLSGQVNIPSGVTLAGEGEGTTLIADHDDEHVLYFEFPQSATEVIRGITVRQVVRRRRHID